MATYDDGEVLCLSSAGAVIQWSGDDNEPYDCGETLYEWGVHNLFDHECARVGVTLEERDLCAAFDPRSVEAFK
jgi:hypothetical protein